jgi:sulfate permease, SulP family
MAHAPEPLSSTLRPDVIAGLTAAAVVLPKAMAYATVAGLSVSVGLYTAFVPMIVYALLGTSRVLSVSSTTTLAILTGVELGTIVPDGDPLKITIAAATLTAITGVLLIGASFLRLGFLANFISAPVLTGFKAGIGMVIVLDQIPKLLGIHISKQGFFRDVASVAQHLSDASLITLSVGAATLLALLALERLKPHSAAPLLVVGVGILASWLFDLSASGVATVGVVPQSLPSITLPSFDLIGELVVPACGIALMSFTETIAAGRAFAAQSDPPIKANRELLATGAANLLGAFFGAMPAGGGTSQTAVVRSVGGRTQTASLVTAGAAAGTMLVFAPFLGFLPQTVLAAIVIVYSVGLINPPEFVAISKIRTMELTWAIAAFLGVLVFGTLQGIVVAIVLSLIGLSSQAVNSKVYVIGRKRGADVLRPLAPENPDDETFDGLLILRPEGRLFFGNAQSVGDQMRNLVAEHRPSVLAIDMSRVPDIEYSALQMLVAGERRMTDAGITVWLAALNPSVLACIRASPLAERLGRERLLFNAREVIRKYQEGAAARPPSSTSG